MRGMGDMIRHMHIMCAFGSSMTQKEQSHHSPVWQL